MVAEHPSELVRDQYLMQVAERTGIDPDRLRDRLAGRGGRAQVVGVGEVRARGLAQGGVHPAEVEALRVAVHHPEAVADSLHEELFEPGVGRRAFVALASAQTLRQALDGAAAAGDEAVADLLQRLAVEEETAEDPMDPVARLAERAVNQRFGSLDVKTRAWVKPLVDQTRDALTRRDATERLVRWLAQGLGEET